LLEAGFQQSALGSDEATSVLVDDSLTDPDTSDSKETNTPPGVLKGIDSLVAEERAAAVREIALLGGEDAFCFITKAFDDQSAVVRNAAARALYDFDADRAASYMRALREATAERRRMIAESIVSSGLAGEAIVKLTAESRQEACDAFSVLFLMARVGELQPLLAAIEEHPDVDTRLAAIRLLALTRRTEILPPFRSLSMQPSIPAEIKSALTEAIYHISGQSQDTASLMA
jgi:HEAT repeat protein